MSSYQGNALFGMDEIQPEMEYTYDIQDIANEPYMNEDLKNNKEDNNNKYIQKNNSHPIKEKFYNTIAPIQHQTTTRYLIDSLYSKISVNIMYLFVILTLILICMFQKMSLDNMKMILMLSLNGDTPNIKMPIT